MGQLALEFPETPAPIEPERWLPVEGWPGYDVSDWGRVRSWLATGYARRGGAFRYTDTPKLIAGQINKLGYDTVALRRVDGSSRRMTVHSLVLEAFVCPRPPGMDGCHTNGVRHDNRLANLRWDTRSANVMDAVRHGTHGSLILTEAQVVEIWNSLIIGDSMAALARKFGVSVGAVAAIKRGTTWDHITSGLLPLPKSRHTPRPACGPIQPPPEFTGTEEEIWRPIPGLPPYRVSTFGRVESSARRGGGGIGHPWKPKSFTTCYKGYLRFSVSHGDRHGAMTVHHAVLLAFAGPCPVGFVGCHNDGNKTNNHAGNLRWDSWRANSQDRIRHQGR
jgi:hypothetical protein